MQARYPEAPSIDARGQYVMPGNICAHTHFYGAYARGMAIPGPAPRDFPQILERLWSAAGPRPRSRERARQRPGLPG